MSAPHTSERPEDALQLPPAWLHTMAQTEPSEAAIWLQEDAAYLYLKAGIFRDAGNDFLATQVQENAAHSAGLARAAIAKATGSAA